MLTLLQKFKNDVPGDRHAIKIWQTKEGVRVSLSYYRNHTTKGARKLISNIALGNVDDNLDELLAVYVSEAIGELKGD